MEIYNEKLLLELAQNGDAKAMLKLGNYYYFPKLDFDSSFNWYQKALDNGNNDALICMARLYEQMDIQAVARLLPENSESVDYELSDTTIERYEKAFEYFKYAANYNSDDGYDKFWIRLSQARLSRMYELGLGCEQNLELSKVYREKAQLDNETYQNIKFYE